MDYSIDYYLLNDKKEVTKAFESVACFSGILVDRGKEKFRNFNATYILFSLKNKSNQLTTQQVYQYLLFLKNIPEFAPYMPYDVHKVATDLEITFDLTKMNGVILFSLLTAVRAVIEDPAIVTAVLAFDPEKEYSWSKLGILKTCGSFNRLGDGHWLTQNIDLKNVNKTPASKAAWGSQTPAKETGLLTILNNTWHHEGDGYTCRTPINDKHIKDVLNETDKVVKKVAVKKPKAVKKTELILDF
jgi:hypothetical protein